MKKDKMWFGCKPCLYEPKRNETKSSDNYNVFTCGKCPKCGKDMHMHIESPPIEVIKARCKA